MSNRKNAQKLRLEQEVGKKEKGNGVSDELIKRIEALEQNYESLVELVAVLEEENGIKRQMEEKGETESSQ